MKAIIAGGGIGGLTSALCLHHFGITPEIHESSPELGEVGAGIQISPNAMKVFQALGIDDALASVAFRPEGIELRMGESGMRLIRTALGDVAEKRWGSSYLHVHRADLVGVLEGAVRARMPNAIRLGSEVASYSLNDAGVDVVFANGETRTADLLIGADGIHSAVRKTMHGPDKPRFTGNVAWRAVVPVERLGSDVPDPVACAWMGRGKHSVTYLLRQGKLANLVAVIERDDWTKESWSERGDKAEALAEFRSWHPSITRIIEESDAMFRWALFDRAPLPGWCDGPVALMGDAAHPMLPFMAQGAAMAIEDAWALAAKVSSGSDVAASLKAYESLRYNRASRVQAASRANGKTFHQRTLPGRLKNFGPMWLAGRMAPGIGLARQDKTYAYNIVEATKDTEF